MLISRFGVHVLLMSCIVNKVCCLLPFFSKSNILCVFVGKMMFSIDALVVILLLYAFEKFYENLSSTHDGKMRILEQMSCSFLSQLSESWLP